MKRKKHRIFINGFKRVKKFSKWFAKNTFTIFSCVAIIVLGMGAVVYATTIGTNISTDGNLTVTSNSVLATTTIASLKLNSASLLTTPESGAIEFDGTKLYYTDSLLERHALDYILFNTPIYTTSSITYQHPRDPSELEGNITYSPSSFNMVGMYEFMTSSTAVSGIKAKVWCKNTSRDVTFKIFARSSTTVFNPDIETPLYSGTISHTIMPHSAVEGGFLFELSDSVTIPAEKYLYVLWETPTTGELGITRYNTNSESAPYRHSFIIGTTNSNFTTTSLPSYAAATFRVYGKRDITKTIVPTLGSEVLVNPGFENPDSGWNDEGFAGSEDETEIIHSGSHAVKMTASGTSWFNPQQYQNISVTPGITYQLSFWTRGDGTHAAEYAIYDRSNNRYLNNTGGGLSTGVTGINYTQVTTTFTAPSGCTSITIFLVTSNIANTVCYFDDVSIKPWNDVITKVPLSLETVLNNFPSTAVTFSDPDSIMTSTNVHDAILEAYNHAGENSASVSLVSPMVVLPDNLYAVVGDELQLFVRGMIEAQNPYNLPYVINSSVGTSYPRYFDYTPVLADVGTKSFTVKVLNYDYSVLTTKTINLKVTNPTGEPASNKNILCLGDSLTAGGVWPAELYRRLTQTGGTPAGLGYGNITFIGDKALPGYSTQAYTGYGGWSYSLYNGTSGSTSGHVLTGTFDKDRSDVGSTWQDSNGNTWSIEYAIGGLKIHGSGTLPDSGTLTHVSGATHTSDIVYTSATTEPESPFWDSANNRLSFSAWAERNDYQSIDAVYVLLGWNSTGGSNNTDYSSYMSNVRTFLDQLHSDFPSTIVRIIGIQIPSVNGGLGTNYGANGGMSEYYGMVRSANSMNIAYQNLANEDGYSSWVQFISIAPQFDSENNMPQSSTAVNTRNSATEYRGTNGVHPATAGYYQIADAVYREFIYTFVSN